MDPSYTVGFKDIYPWVWSVMLGIALALAQQRGAFAKLGRESRQRFSWAKNVTAVFVNVIVPIVVFVLTMTRLGPMYSKNMGFWQTLGSLYLAGVPLGTQHLWYFVAEKFHWMIDLDLQEHQIDRRASRVWMILAFVFPTLAAIFRFRVPF
jgi:hypothetical protein